MEVGMAIRTLETRADGTTTLLDDPELVVVPIIRRVGLHLGGIAGHTDAASAARVLRRASGVLDVVVSPVTEIAYIAFDASRTDADTIRHQIDASGYGPVTVWRP
jgi:hypothetical protein